MNPDLATESGDKLAGQFEALLETLREGDAEWLEAEGNRPLALDDPDGAWLVCEGKADVFAVARTADGTSGSRRHVFRAERGHALFGVPAESGAPGIGLLAVGGPGTRLLKVRRCRLAALGTERGAAVAALLETWVMALSRALATEAVPHGAVQLDAGESELPAGQSARARRGVLWVRTLEGTTQWMERAELPAPAADLALPITRYTWLRAESPARLSACTTDGCLVQDPEWTSLAAFHQLALNAIQRRDEQTRAADRARIEAKAESDRAAVAGAITQLASLLQAEGTRPAEFGAGDTDPLLAACRAIAASIGAPVRALPHTRRGLPAGEVLKAFAHAADIRTREVALKGDWWRRDNGALLAFREADKRPLALLPLSPGRYEVRDFVAHTRAALTPALAAELAPFAHCFYPPFPHRVLSALDLLRFGAGAIARDWATILLTGLLGGLLALATPLAMGYVFDTAVPSADRAMLLTIGLALFAAAFTTATLHVARGIAALRIEGRMNTLIEAAVWDRLLDMPPAFFRNYSSGDLSTRAMGIAAIRRAVSSTLTSALLTTVFSVFTLALLFGYEARLALVALALVAGAAVVTLAAGYLQLRFQREQVELQGRISGLVLQIIGGLAKFRVAGAEGHAFALWAKSFAAQRQLAFKARTVHNGLAVFNAAYPLLTLMIIFAMLGLSGRSGLTTGGFLAFNAAFGQLMTTGFLLSSALITLLSLVPVYERAKPILQTLPEVDPTRQHPGELSGDIEVNHVSFRYRATGPLILRDVSLRIKPGEFVALVGASGSGKSTLLRLLLGFETPDSGAIYYDGRDLAGLDLRAVRQQLGVVLQTARLMTGDILSNIVGSAPLTLDDAWAAAALCGLDEDIKQMPMGMHTLISENGSTFSGGQRQRLLIARALVKKPRILLFDESTSALDNRTQEIVARNLQGLHAARLVIAHRLSTIQHADRIYVLDEGRIVQEGTYQELMAQPGRFHDLASRQIA